MWQDIIVCFILALGAGCTLQRFYEKFTSQASCCGGGCTCKGSCEGSCGDAGAGKSGGKRLCGGSPGTSRNGAQGCTANG